MVASHGTRIITIPDFPTELLRPPPEKHIDPSNQSHQVLIVYWYKKYPPTFQYLLIMSTFIASMYWTYD